MKKGSKQYAYMKRLLQINPSLTAAQCAKRIKLLNSVLAIREGVYA